MLLIAPVSLWAQESYEEGFEKAFQLREKGKIQEALVEFQALSKVHQKDPAIRYSIAGLQALQGHHEKSLGNLKIALRYDKDLSIFVGIGMYMGFFIKLLDLPVWNEVETMVSKNLPFKKKTLTIQLWKIYIRDQAYYWHLFTVARNLGAKSPVVSAIWELKTIPNIKNQQEVIRLITQHGWPKHSEVGKVAGAAFFVIQHASYELQKQYLPLLEDACQAGEADWSNYALMYDRIKLNETGRQLYGTQLTEDMKGFRPIEDIEHLNERRLNKKLPLIEDYATYWGLNWEDILLRMR